MQWTFIKQLIALLLVDIKAWSCGRGERIMISPSNYPACERSVRFLVGIFLILLFGCGQYSTSAVNISRKDILDSLFDGYDAWISPSFDKTSLRYSGQYLLEIVSLNGSEWKKNHHMLALSDRNSITYWNWVKDMHISSHISITSIAFRVIYTWK